MSGRNDFRVAVLQLCAEFNLPRPNTINDLLKLCEHIIFQGQLEFTEEQITNLSMSATLDNGMIYAIREDGVDEE